MRKSKQRSIGARNRRKGNAFELEVIHKLREIGYTDCISSRAGDKSVDSNKIDIISKELPVNIQCKYTKNGPNYFEIEKECSDKTKPFVIIWKKAGTNGSHSPGTLSLISFEYFLNLLKNEKEKN